MNDTYSKIVLSVIAVSLSILALKNLDIIGSANAVVDYHPKSYNLVTHDSKPMVGEIKIFAGDVLPAGWAFCDGREVKIHHYPDLFDIIGGTYGAGDGETTFNLPDLRGRTVRGIGNNEKIGEVELGQEKIYFANLVKEPKTIVNKASLGSVSKKDGMSSKMNLKNGNIARTGDLGLNYIICWKGTVPE